MKVISESMGLRVWDPATDGFFLISPLGFLVALDC